MKFLFDENMYPGFVAPLKSMGYEAIHVYDIGLDNTPDEKIIEFAKKSGHAILTNDLDFTRIMALSGSQFPTILTFRFAALNPAVFTEIVQNNFPKLLQDITAGSLITIDERGIRVKKLPVFK